MYPFLAKTIIYPLGDLAFGSSVIKYFRSLQKTQWCSAEQLRELQNKKLRDLIKHAYNNVPYYHRIFDQIGITDKDIKTVDDLIIIPILTKNDIRKYFSDIVVKDLRKWKAIINFSGGSTGEPLKYLITKDVASIGWAGKFRGWGWAGYKIGDKRISFGGSSLVPNKTPTRFETIRCKIERNLPISAVSMNDEKYSKFISTIFSYKPKFLYGYASSIYSLANYCKLERINNIHFDAIFTTAEVLQTNFRKSIEDQFKCEVFDQYGAYDSGIQAMECHAHQGLHICSENAFLEIVDDNGQRLIPGQSGRIIATDMHNYAMPFIRYEVGDLGALAEKPCICGRGLPLLKSIEGRTTDIIRLSNGISLAGPAITLIFKDSNVKQYQLRRVAGDELLIKIVKEKNYSEKDTEHIMSILKNHAGIDIKIKMEFCESIPRELNNKYRFILTE